jgi:hypothetical protein
VILAAAGFWLVGRRAAWSSVRCRGEQQSSEGAVFRMYDLTGTRGPHPDGISKSPTTRRWPPGRDWGPDLREASIISFSEGA